MSIRTDIFKNNTTLFGILDEEGVPDINGRFSLVEDQVSDLKTRTQQTQEQLVDLSTIVAKNRADFNTFEVKTNNVIVRLEEGVAEANVLAIAADKVAKEAQENSNAALTLTHELEVRVIKVSSDLDNTNQRVEDLSVRISGLGREVQTVVSNVDLLNLQVAQLQLQISQISNPFVILQKRMNFYYQDQIGSKVLFIDWDIPSLENGVETIVKANENNWAMITSSEGGTRRGLVTLVATWDVFRLTGSIPYPILQGNVQCLTLIGSTTTTYTGTALVDK
jgi:hypothetical protein